MNIGLDGSFAILKNNTTEGNYSKIVVNALAECFPKHKLYVYTPWIEHRSAATSLSIQMNVVVKQPRSTLSKRLWMHWKGVVEELDRHHVHVYHGLAGRLPLRIKSSRARSIVTIHSLAPIRFPHDYEWWQRKKRGFVTRQSCRLADAIVTTSEHMRDDLVEQLGIDSSRIHVIYPAVDQRFLNKCIDAELDAVRDKYKLPSRYILVVSSLLEHKNVLAVMQAMERLDDHEVQLVLLGNNSNYYDTVLRPYAEQHHLLHRLTHITRAHAMDMSSLYHLAQVLVAPSRYEGFGLTVIEAQACGVPVITTSGTSLEEAAGNAALFFEPDDVATLASHLDRVLSDDDLRQQLISAGQQNIQRFTRDKLADSLNQLYHQVMGRTRWRN